MIPHKIFQRRLAYIIDEPRREKTELVFIAHVKTKAQISFAVTAKLISVFVFATRIVQFLLKSEISSF